MAKEKKVCCKHGLTKNEEIQARRLRRKLEEGDETSKSMVCQLYNEWYTKPMESFLDWLTRRDKILASALQRLPNWPEIVLGKSTD